MYFYISSCFWFPSHYSTIKTSAHNIFSMHNWPTWGRLDYGERWASSYSHSQKWQWDGFWDSLKMESDASCTDQSNGPCHAVPKPTSDDCLKDLYISKPKCGMHTSGTWLTTYTRKHTHKERISNGEWDTRGGHSKSGLPISLAVSKNLRLSLSQRTVWPAMATDP